MAKTLDDAENMILLAKKIRDCYWTAQRIFGEQLEEKLEPAINIITAAATKLNCNSTIAALHLLKEMHDRCEVNETSIMLVLGSLYWMVEKRDN